ncbi:MAG: DUF1847 domain-containing protein [Bacteroidales bacterium]|nr:DUF1847 domain-containing protein [Bacteroidales bacterium]
MAFEKEAEELVNILSLHFEVIRANCKLGRLLFNDILPGYQGVSCNPAGQAKHLEDSGTELNIVMGLCLGHDMVFQQKSKAPGTTLVVKDRKLKHNPMERLRVGGWVMIGRAVAH